MALPLAVGVVLLAAAPGAPNDVGAGRWLVDPDGVVARNDVLYTTPSVEPWEAMPVGGGDLSAMVRCDGDLHVHLTKTDAWGFATDPDAPQGTRFFTNVSPGHVRLRLGEGAKTLARRRFRQRLDLAHGRVVIDLGEDVRMSVWGHPRRKVLVVEVEDPRGALGPSAVELSEWRGTMVVGASATTLSAREVDTRPARPHLANTGMDGYFPEGHDPLQGRGTAVVVSASVRPEGCSAEGQVATMRLPAERRYRILIAAAVTVAQEAAREPSVEGHRPRRFPVGDPLAAAQRELRSAERVPLERLRAEHQAWWREYWGRSLLRVSSPDRKADWLCAAYHVHLYTLGCTGRGVVPPKWDGGAGLFQGDERNWGLAEWVQEIRFTYLPLYAANRLEMARGLADHYSAMLPYLEAQTRTMWGIPGLWIPETVLPWGHAEDWALKDDGHVQPYMHPWDPKSAPYGRFERYNPYIGFLLTAGLEVCQHYITYHRTSGDERFLRDQAYPVLRDVCRFVAGLFRKGDDGRVHLGPANALETWWMVRDPADTLAGVRAIFPEFLRLSEAYGRDAEVRAQCAAVLEALPDDPRGLWTEDGPADPDADLYAPAAALGSHRPRQNCENPGLYRVFPFGLSGIGSPDVDRARRTFARRICVLNHGWAMDALWAARLGLGEEACDLLAQHATRYNRYRYGGWTSNDSQVLPGGLSAAPFLDAAGLSAFGLQEVLLQSHNGLIRVAPAIAESWSGVFRLRAEGGFLVGATVEGGQVAFVEIRSRLGKPCALANPWGGACVVREGGRIRAQTEADVVRFRTRRGATYLITPADGPPPAPRPPADAPNDAPGLPGRGW